jgi:hypothetical protein
MDALHSLSARWPEVDRLLDEALALPVCDHAGWLARLEGDRAALRETLAKLLRAHAEAESAGFMGTLPQVGLPADAEFDGADDCDDGRDELAAGEAVGPYRLIQPLGRGGMGSVWLAERADGQFKRQVALKLPRLAGGRTVAERLAREREVLATLAHPHIARLYDAGVDARGRPWLAMEAVAGQRIDRWCDEHHSPVAERLRLLLQGAEVEVGNVIVPRVIAWLRSSPHPGLPLAGTASGEGSAAFAWCRRFVTVSAIVATHPSRHSANDDASRLSRTTTMP